MTRKQPPAAQPAPVLDLETRLRLFDEATQRQLVRNRRGRRRSSKGDRGWQRADLYQRGRAR